MRNMLRTITIEILTGLLIGGAPVLIVFITSDYENMVETLSGMTPSDEIVRYFVVLAAIHLFFHFSDKFLLKKYNPKLETEKASVYLEAIKNAGSSLHGIYRVLLGSVPVATGITLWLFVFHQAALALTFLTLIFWVGCLFMCVLSAKTQEQKNKK